MTAAEALAPLEKPGAFSLWLNGVPFLHAASGLLAAFTLAETAGARAALLLAWIYVLPPLAARVTLTLFGRPAGRLTQDMRAYKVWWFLTQVQTLFNRLPVLEELLRLVPGLYPLWIKLWGGGLSPFAYVGPGVIITDRWLVNVARGAVLGWNSALAGHMVIRDAAGRFVVVVAAPCVEAEAILGGGAALGPGAALRAGASLPAGRRVAPFGEWPGAKARGPA
jgi:hypothetical protein